MDLTIKGNSGFRIMSFDKKSELFFCYHKDSIKEPYLSKYDIEISLDDLKAENNESIIEQQIKNLILCLKIKNG